MQTTNFSDFRANLASTFDNIAKNHTELLITRRNSENMVVMSESDYSALNETLYLLSSPANAKHLIEAINNPKIVKTMTIEEIEAFGED